jgi:hypothetical protein
MPICPFWPDGRHEIKPPLSKAARLCFTRVIKPGADRGFFVERAALFFVTSRFLPFVLKNSVEIKPPLSKAVRLCCTRLIKPGTDRGFFVERAALFCDFSVVLC